MKEMKVVLFLLEDVVMNLHDASTLCSSNTK